MPYFDVKSPRRGAKIRLDAPFFVIGRGERIPIFHDDPSISREHAAIVIREAGVRVRDLGSKNGVLVNGTAIGRYAEVALQPGDTLKVGATTLTLRAGEPPARVAKAPEPTPPPEEAPAPPPAAPSKSEDGTVVDAPVAAPPPKREPVLLPDSSASAVPTDETPVEDLSRLEQNPAPTAPESLSDSSESDGDPNDAERTMIDE